MIIYVTAIIDDSQVNIFSKTIKWEELAPRQVCHVVHVYSVVKWSCLFEEALRKEILTKAISRNQCMCG